jgi:hypothetical protein
MTCCRHFALTKPLPLSSTTRSDLLLRTGTASAARSPSDQTPHASGCDHPASRHAVPLPSFAKWSNVQEFRSTGVPPAWLMTVAQIRLPVYLNIKDLVGPERWRKSIFFAPRIFSNLDLAIARTIGRKRTELPKITIVIRRWKYENTNSSASPPRSALCGASSDITSFRPRRVKK